MKNDDLKKYTNKMVALNSWLPIVVSVAMLVFITLLKGLMDFDFSQLTQLSFWAESLLSGIVGSIVFSYSYFTFIKKERSLDNTVYSVEAHEHYQYQDIIRKKQLRDVLIPKVEEENKRRKTDAIIKQISNYGLIWDEFAELKESQNLKDDLKKMAFKKMYSKKKSKKFYKTINQMINGKVHYTEFTIDSLLNDNDLEKDIVSDDTMSENHHYHSNTIFKKTIKTLCFSTLLATLVSKAMFDSTWLEILIKNASIIFSNCLSASLQAKNYINYRRCVLHNRNVFFSNSIPKEYLEVKDSSN